ncbi:hypothetical protein ACFY3U_09580 [Micromonospora sp. NPDC000089]|uniref:hypothetical protein n=1 Tax=unclassified Micromonospora TaxID=2617518 RepID=UPI00367A3DAA
MNVRTPRLALLAAGALALGATLTAALPASASTPVRQAAAATDGAPLTSIAIAATGKIDANGAVVFVPVTLTCSQPTQVDLTVKVAEAVGEDISTGTTTRKVTCEAGTQKIRISVTPTERRFVPGVAFGTVTGNSCDALCNSLTSERNITLAL